MIYTVTRWRYPAFCLLHTHCRIEAWRNQRSEAFETPMVHRIGYTRLVQYTPSRATSSSLPQARPLQSPPSPGPALPTGKKPPYPTALRYILARRTRSPVTWLLSCSTKASLLWSPTGYRRARSCDSGGHLNGAHNTSLSQSAGP